MNVIARSTLKAFWTNPSYKDSEQPLKSWYVEARAANWTGPQDIKDQYGSASIIGNNRVVFNIKGNDYRLVVAFQYWAGIVAIRFFGTHSEYDRIDAETV